MTPGAPSRALLPPATISTPVRIKKEKPDPAPAKGKRRAVSQDVSADEADAAADSDVVEVSEVVRPPPAHGTRAQRKEKIAARPESVRKRAKVVEVLESEEEELATAAKPDDAADDPPASTTPAAPVAILPNLGGSGPCLAGTIDELVDNQYEYVNECPNDLQLSLHH